MSNADNLKNYTAFEFDDGRWKRTVYRRGSGPAVIIIHEMPGINPQVLRFADRVAAAGHTVFLPSLTGEPGREVAVGYTMKEMLKAMCVRREITAWAADRSSPIVDWLRLLARKVHGECGGPGVGALGMCFSGGFALAMMTESVVKGAVMSQPGFPMPVSKRAKASMAMSPAETETVRKRLENENRTVIGLRFLDDPLVPDERFASYRSCFGEHFEAIEIDPADAAPGLGGKPHAVLTINLKDDDPTGPTKRAEQRVIEYFSQCLLG